MKRLTRKDVDSYAAILKASKSLDGLSHLVKMRKEFYTKNKTRLSRWLLHNSILLESNGMFYLFSSNSGKKFADIEDVTDQILKDFSLKSGGDIDKLPIIGNICNCCGKEVTLEDVYNHNFHIYGMSAYHSNDCKDFRGKITAFNADCDSIIYLIKRVFGEIKDLNIKYNFSRGRINITFRALNIDFEVYLVQYGNEIKIYYIKDEYKTLIIKEKHYYSNSPEGIEKELKKFANKLNGKEEKGIEKIYWCGDYLDKTLKIGDYVRAFDYPIEISGRITEMFKAGPYCYITVYDEEKDEIYNELNAKLFVTKQWYHGRDIFATKETLKKLVENVDKNLDIKSWINLDKLRGNHEYIDATDINEIQLAVGMELKSIHADNDCLYLVRKDEKTSKYYLEENNPKESGCKKLPISYAKENLKISHDEIDYTKVSFY